MTKQKALQAEQLHLWRQSRVLDSPWGQTPAPPKKSLLWIKCKIIELKNDFTCLFPQCTLCVLKHHPSLLRTSYVPVIAGPQNYELVLVKCTYLLPNDSLHKNSSRKPRSKAHESPLLSWACLSSQISLLRGSWHWACCPLLLPARHSATWLSPQSQTQRPAWPTRDSISKVIFSRVDLIYLIKGEKS